MTTSARQRKIWSVVLGALGLVLFAAFATLNAWDPKVIRPATTGLIFLYTALSALAFVVFVGVLLMLVRNVLKLYADQKSRVMGSRLRTRMLWGAVLVSLVPLISMFSFSYLLMNRAVDRWFTQPVTEMRDDSNRIAVELSQYTAANARVEAEAIAGALGAAGGKEAEAGAGRPAIQRVLREHEVTLQSGLR
jgi:two-component system nitrogen regulation sensor histidine kinase NtrY